MKLDMGRAWNDAMAKLSANREMVLIVSGVFFFLPYLALAFFMPTDIAQLQAGGGPRQPNFEQLGELMLEFYSSFWWAFLLIGILQGIGTLVLMIVLADRTRPTLGEALALGVKLYLPLFAAQFLTAIAMILMMMAPIVLGAAGAASGATFLVVLAVLLGIAVVVATIYIYTKLSLTPAVFAVEQTMNPIDALRQSWRTTKGNSLMLFLFYVLLILAIAVISFILSMVTGLIFALTGPQAALYGNGFVSSLVNAATAALMAAVVVSVYLQLTGGGSAAVSETFE